MIDNDTLSTVTHQVDATITELLTRTNIGLLPLSAVFVARLVLANDEVGMSDDIRQLLVEAAHYPPKSEMVMQ